MHWDTMQQKTTVNIPHTKISNNFCDAAAFREREDELVWALEEEELFWLNVLRKLSN
jgi:hypothetical protein